VAGEAGSGTERPSDLVRVTLLGPFTIRLGERSAGPWYRPPAKRLCELVMVSPGIRVGREVARDLLFADLGPIASANALSRALSLAREALSVLGEEVAGRLRADRAHIWFSTEAPLDIDLVAHEGGLRSALAMEPGGPRDVALSKALAEDGVLLEDEPYADWALRPREALELVRQRARLELARDRARGRGRSAPEAVIEAWEDCLAHDPPCEEAASSLMRVYAAQGRRQLVASTYQRCRSALAALGLRVSPALGQAQLATVELAPRSGRASDGLPVPRRPLKEERRLVSVLFAELSGPVGMGRRLDPEDLRQVVGEALAGVIAEVEGLGGTVTSVSGAGLAALFGAPEAHEDDPERAVRAGSRILRVVATGSHGPEAGTLSVRVGIESGPAVVGPIAGGAGYGAVGEVVGAAASLQSAAKAGSVLVGSVTRGATEKTFVWGPTEDVVPTPGGKPLAASYLERPEPRPSGYRGQRRVAGRAPLVGRQKELSRLDGALREALSGTGSAVFLIGEPGIGKTRLVQECRKRFMAWVGAGTGRLPLWLEGRCASFASTTPYGLYLQLLSAWVGVIPEEPEQVVRPALERAMKAVFGTEVNEVGFLAHMMGLQPGQHAERLGQLSPEGLQRATFASVKSVVERLARRGPTVLVLEDLHWADPISLRLTAELVTLTQSLPLLLIATRRPEPDPEVSALEAALEAGSACTFRRLELSALSDEAERELARSMVGPEAASDVIATLRRNADGNPFFLEQRFDSLVETGALVKDATSWSLSGTDINDVPHVLERLIRSRVDRLPPVAREVVVAASVLGPEFALSALKAVTERPDELTAAVNELCSAGLLLEPRRRPEPVYRFRHALIQEATYGSLLRRQRAELHARAAWGLEALSTGRLEEIAAVLGHHYAMAGENERAVHHLEVAARHAVAHYALDEAVASYRKAIQINGSTMTGQGPSELAVELRAQLAGVLWRNTRLAEAREMLQEALVLVGPERPLRAASLQARLGRVEAESGLQRRSDQCYHAAMAAFDVAEELLGNYTEERSDEWVDVWLEVLIDGRAHLYNSYCEPERAIKVLSRARPVAQTRGSPNRKAGLFVQLGTQRIIDCGGHFDEGTVALARDALEAAEKGADEHVLAICLTWLGETLLHNGELVEAEEKLKAGLAVLERVDDPHHRGWCLCLCCLLEVRRRDVEAVRSLSRHVGETGISAEMPMWLAAATATEAWIAWKDGRPQEVVGLASEARELSRTLGDLAHALLPQFEGLWLWPLISVHLSSGQFAAAVEAACWVLESPLLRPPDEIASLVRGAKEAWDYKEEKRATRMLSQAVELASQLGYC
jgi:class 3 adenylate cyclase/tetratricopeptide (TPR) repeat protein